MDVPGERMKPMPEDFSPRVDMEYEAGAGLRITCRAFTPEGDEMGIGHITTDAEGLANLPFVLRTMKFSVWQALQTHEKECGR